VAVVAGAAVWLLMIGIGCRTPEKTTTPDDEMAPSSQEKWVSGTVQYIELEGGFYAIEADDGARYYPLNLEETYKRHGMRVRFTMRERPDVMTTVMWGTNVDIQNIEAL
jgi:hypothetical protein